MADALKLTGFSYTCISTQGASINVASAGSAPSAATQLPAEPFNLA